MSFEAPLLGAAAWLAWLPILWWHRRRREAPPTPVPSLAPWRALGLRPAPRRRRIRASWLLALHLAAAGALAGALARPVIGVAPSPADGLALVVDASTSMRADGRWERAVARAQALGRAARGPLTLVVLGPEPTLVAAAARDRRAALDALAATTPAGRGGDLAAALDLARAAGGLGARLVVISDGGLSPPDRAPEGWSVERVDAGRAPGNGALLSAAARRDDARAEVILAVTVARFGPGDAPRALSVAVDGRVAATERVAASAASPRTLTWRVRPDARWATIRLEGEDALPLDDVAVVSLEPAPIVAQLVGSSEPVARALEADAGVRLERAGPATLRTDGGVDVTVVAGLALGRPPPGGLLTVAPPVAAGAATDPPASARIEAVGDHSLVAGLDLAEARLGGLWASAAPEWAAPVLWAGGRVAVYAGVHGGRREVVLAFDPALGDVAARTGFPLLVARAVEWLAAPSAARRGGSQPLGSSLALAPPATVVRPDGRRLRAVDSLRLDAAGMYLVGRGRADPPARVVANAGDALESDLGRAPLAARAAAAGAGDGATGRPLWRALALLALALVALEAAWRAAPTRGRGRRP